MAASEPVASLDGLDLPAEFEDLSGLLHADLNAIVAMLTQRANERLFLTGREFQLLQTSLWNNLRNVVQEALEPLSTETR
jgi:hypothetical protein